MASFCVVWLQIADECVDKIVEESWATDFNMEFQLQSTPYYFNPHVGLIFVMRFKRFELEHHIISMPPTLSQQRVFLSYFPCLEAIKIPANSETCSRLNSIYAHKYDPDSPHPGLGVHSLSHPKVIWKMLSNHPCCQSFIVMQGRKEMLLANFRIEVLNTFANPILSLLTSIFQLFSCFVCGSW